MRRRLNLIAFIDLFFFTGIFPSCKGERKEEIIVNLCYRQGHCFGKLGNPQRQIFDGENFYLEQKPPDYRNIQPEKLYRIKHHVESISDTVARYSAM